MGNNNPLINNGDTETLQESFDYEQWKSNMERLFGSTKEEILKRTASDELYFKDLQNKIQQNVQKQKKNQQNKEPERVLMETNTVNITQPSRGVNEMSQLKLKEKERKRKKQEAAFLNKVENSVDKVKEMSLKSQKLEKISAESEKEILKIKEIANKLVARSQTNEQDFNLIFTDIDNIENIIPDTENTKKGRKGKKKVADKKQPSILENEVHWTEEENNKWSTDKKEVTRVTDLLSALRTAAAAGATDFVTTSIQDTIKNCKRMQDEHEKEKQAEILERKQSLQDEQERKKAAQEAKKLEDQKKQEEAKMMEQRRRKEGTQRLDEQRKREEAKKLDEQRKKQEAKKLEEQRKKEEAKKLEAQRKIEEVKKLEEQRKKEEVKKLEEQRKKEEA